MMAPSSTSNGADRKRSDIVLAAGLIFGVIYAIWIGHELGGGDHYAHKIGGLIGSILGGMLLAYLLGWAIKPVRRFLGPPLGVLIGVALFVGSSLQDLNFRSSVAAVDAAIEKSSNRDELLQHLRTLEGGNRMAEALLKIDGRVEDRWRAVTAQYPALVDPILEEPLNPQSRLSELQMRRDAFGAAADSVSALRAEIPKMVDELTGVISEELQRAGAPGSSQARLQAIVAANLQEESAVLDAYYAAAARKHEASKLVLDHLVNSFGAWHLESNGSLIFETQAQADRFNLLSGEEAKAVEELGNYTARIQNVGL